MCKIVILFLNIIKMCKIGLQAADYKITSPVLCDIVFWTLFCCLCTGIILNINTTNKYPVYLFHNSQY